MAPSMAMDVSANQNGIYSYWYYWWLIKVSPIEAARIVSGLGRGKSDTLARKPACASPITGWLAPLWWPIQIERRQIPGFDSMPRSFPH